MLSFFIIVGFLLLLISTRPFTVLFHELGHAIPAILFSHQKVTIYLGSYGKEKRSFLVRLGLLEVWISYNLFWIKGLCIAPAVENLSFNKKLVYFLCGPASSLLIALTGTFLIFSFDLHGLLKIFISLLLLSAVLDLFINLIPSSTQIVLHNGTVTYNDGYKIRLLIKDRKIPHDYWKAVDSLNAKEYRQALSIFESLVERKFRSEDFYRSMIVAYYSTEEFHKALFIHKLLVKQYKSTSDDYCNAGLIQSSLHLHEESIVNYDKSIKINPVNIYALNNKGFALNLLEKYKEAIIAFDAAISYEPAFSYSYSNRGLSKLKVGNIEEGLQDINYALELNSEDSYAYRSLGIFALDQSEHTKALEYFQQAKKLNSFTYSIDAYISKALAC